MDEKMLLATALAVALQNSGAAGSLPAANVAKSITLTAANTGNGLGPDVKYDFTYNTRPNTQDGTITVTVTVI